jgi:hypothetical protein
MCNPVKFVPKQFFISEQYKNFVREQKNISEQKIGIGPCVIV